MLKMARLALLALFLSCSGFISYVLRSAGYPRSIIIIIIIIIIIYEMGANQGL